MITQVNKFFYRNVQGLLRFGRALNCPHEQLGGDVSLSDFRTYSPRECILDNFSFSYGFAPNSALAAQRVSSDFEVVVSFVDLDDSVEDAKILGLQEMGDRMIHNTVPSVVASYPESPYEVFFDRSFSPFIR